jgi:predicted HTH transcriptional regulator
MFHVEILIKGKMDPHWSDWFEEMQVLPNADGNTLLIGIVQDKSAVYGVLSRLSSLGFMLISTDCQEVIQHNTQEMEGLCS